MTGLGTQVNESNAPFRAAATPATANFCTARRASSDDRRQVVASHTSFRSNGHVFWPVAHIHTSVESCQKHRVILSWLVETKTSAEHSMLTNGGELGHVKLLLLLDASSVKPHTFHSEKTLHPPPAKPRSAWPPIHTPAVPHRLASPRLASHQANCIVAAGTLSIIR